RVVRLGEGNVRDVRLRSRARRALAERIERCAGLRGGRDRRVGLTRRADDVSGRVPYGIDRILQVLVDDGRLFRDIARIAVVGGDVPVEVAIECVEVALHPEDTAPEHLIARGHAALQVGALTVEVEGVGIPDRIERYAAVEGESGGLIGGELLLDERAVGR